MLEGGVFFLLEKAGKENKYAKKNLKIDYDEDGCYCLIIAIMLNIGATKAWSVYLRGGKANDRQRICGKTDRSDKK